VITIEKNGSSDDDGLRTTQVVPPLSSETLRSSEVKSSENNGSEHRRISEASGGGIEIDLEKKKALRNCMKCGSSTGEVQTHRIAGGDVDLHQTCVPFWLRDPTPNPSLLELPEFLDRRGGQINGGSGGRTS
jgi:hypothetical protein